MQLNIGQKIKALRLASNLTQTELADRANLTKGFISQLENDQTSIGVDSLADMLEALGVSLTEFFSDDTDVQVVFSPEDRVAVEGKGAESFELLVPGSTNNMMDPIMLTLGAGERLEEGDPHPGEQFGYILDGAVTLRLGKTLHHVPRHHCFHFKADQTHQLINSGKRPARILWIVAPPQM
ncbi:MAG: helix-turn-helix domain-containing protein [candidate division Zixibacteria bacterium]|nr:helix-turn-helix domain-containing protein [candidate division Zixibacteria bacterium]